MRLVVLLGAATLLGACARYVGSGPGGSTDAIAPSSDGARDLAQREAGHDASLDIPVDAPLTFACSGVGGGTHMGTTTTVNGRIELALTFNAGNYTSRICDAGKIVHWAALRPVPAAAYGKPLLSTSETGYAETNAVATGLVGLWHLDGATGAVPSDATIVDSSGLGIDGLTRNADGKGLARVAGKLGAALSCDGVDDHVEIGANAALKGFAELTVQAWVRAAYSGPSAGYMRIVSLWETGDKLGSTFQLSHFPSGNIAFMAIAKGGTGTAVAAPWNQEAGDWHHIVGVHDGVSLKLYIDGAEHIDDEPTTGALADRAGALFFCQGGSATAPPIYVFDGALDEVAIWKRTLSATEVRGLYARGAAGLSYQVRSCDDSTCSDGQTFVGPDGTAKTFYTEASNKAPGPPVFPLKALANTRYFQWRAYFERDDPELRPRLHAVTVGATSP